MLMSPDNSLLNCQRVHGKGRSSLCLAFLWDLGSDRRFQLKLMSHVDQSLNRPVLYKESLFHFELRCSNLGQTSESFHATSPDSRRGDSYVKMTVKLVKSFKFKGGLYLKAVFPPLNLGLMQISRSRFKQSKNSMLISQIYVLR